MRRQARLASMYKMCHGLLDGNWGEYLKQNTERRTRNSHDFKILIPKGNKDIFRFSFFPGTINDWNILIKLPSEIVLAKSISSFKTN